MPSRADPDKTEAWRDPRVAAEYDARRFASPLQRKKHRRDARLVLSLLAAAGDVHTVLDLPCGTGRLLPALGAAGYRTLGADVSRPMLAARKRRGPAGLFQADGARLPLRSASVDAVVSLRFLFHWRERPRRVAFLSEMGRVSAGAVIVQVRYRWNAKHLGRWLRSRVGAAARYRPSQGRRLLAAELADAGLELIELAPVSRLFSDKALVLARPSRAARAAAPRA